MNECRTEEDLHYSRSGLNRRNMEGTYMYTTYYYEVAAYVIDHKVTVRLKRIMWQRL